MTTRLFGEPVERREDARLLTGGGRYTDDFEHAAAEAAFVRSEHAHARIADVDVSGALDVDGVLAVYTYEDLEGAFSEPLPLLTPHEGLVAPRTQYMLARGEVRYAGETIAMVVAADRYVAEDAAGRIRVAYEPLPVAVDLVAAARGRRQPGRPLQRAEGRRRRRAGACAACVRVALRDRAQRGDAARRARRSRALGRA